MNESYGLFRDLCDNAHDLIQSVLPNSRFQYVNRAWLETLEYTEAQVGDLTLRDVIHPDRWVELEDVVSRATPGEGAVAVETDFQASDGRRVGVEGRVIRRVEADGTAALIGMFRDITGTKDAEEELDRLFVLSLDMLCVAGTDGYFKQINPAFRRVLGYSQEELLSRSFLEFVHPDDQEGTLAAVAQLAEGLPVVDFENRYMAIDGKYRWLAWRSAPVAERGLIYAVARDITEQKHIEQVMARQAEDLARSNADLEQFAYAASHDLRAPLRAIGNLAEWIDEDLPSGGLEQPRQQLTELRHQVVRMENLIEDLLSYARAGREAGELHEVDTSAMVNELTALLAPPPGFKIVTTGDMPVFATHRAPLEQVLRNLIGNAIKHHDRPDGRVEVSAIDRDDFYEFQISDDGPGIPDESRDAIFKMFQKLSSGSDADGTGIGLALVKRSVEAQHGIVWVESPADRGAVFHFTWPKRPLESD